jgi:glycine/D-amino acid oxidase-like deaminating enzyme
LLKFHQDLFINTLPAAVVRQDAGIRPGTLDKQPFIGSHPAKEYASIFNGFGSTGALKIPYYADQFTRHLLHAAPLPASVNINRYYARYSPG